MLEVLLLIVVAVLAAVALSHKGAMAGLELKIGRLEAEIASLKRRLFAFEKKAVDAGEPAVPAVHPEPGVPPPLPARVPHAASAAGPARERAPVPPRAGRSTVVGHSTASAESDLELRIGARWATWVGIVAIVFSMAFLLRWTFENNVIGPKGRIALGFLAGLAFVAGGLVLHRRRTAPYLSDGLVGGGLGMLYLTVFAAHHFYAFLEPPAAFGLMFIVTVAGSGIAVGTRRQAMAVLAVLGGLLTPILISTDHPDELMLLGYLIVLNLLILGVSRYRSWPALNRLGWTGSVLLFLPVLLWHPGADRPGPRLALLSALFALFLVVPILQAWMERRRSEAIDLAFVICNAAAYYAAVYATLDAWRPDLETPWTLGLAAVYVVLAARYHARVPGDPLGVDLHLCTAAVLLTIAVPLAFDGPWVTLAWAAQGVALVALAPRMPRMRTPAAFGLLALLFATGRAIWLDRYWGVPAVPVFNIDYLVHLLVVAALGLGGLLAPRLEEASEGTGISGEDLRTVLWGIGAALLCVLLWREPRDLWPAALLTIELLGLAALARWQGDRAFVIASALVAFAVMVRIWIVDWDLARAAAVELVNPPLLLRIGACAALAVAGGWIARSPAPINTDSWSGLLRGAGGVLLLVALSQDWYEFMGYRIRGAIGGVPASEATDLRWTRDVGLSILWTCYAAAALGRGFLKDSPALRYSGLCLFGVVILKVFLLDLSELEAIYRILSFLVLGVVLLGVSALYQWSRRAPGAGGP